VSRRPRAGLRRLGVYIGDQRRRVWALVGACAAAAAAQVGGWLLVRDAVDNGMQTGDQTRLVIDVAIYICLNAAGWAIGSWVIRGLAGVGQGIVLNLRRHLFGHLTTLSLRYFSQQKAGWIIARLTSDIDALSDVLSQGLSTLVANTLMFAVAVSGLLVVDWRLAGVALVIMPFAVAFSWWFQVKSVVAYGEVRNRIAAVTAQMAESIAGMAVIQAFRREASFAAGFSELNLANRAANSRAQTIWAVFFPGIELLGVCATLAVLWVGAILVHDHNATLGTVIAFIGLLSLLFQPLQELSELYGQVQSASAAMVKISTVLDTETDIADAADAEEVGRLEGRIDFERVTFAYGADPVLNDVDLSVPAGSCLALVGASGGGKSTMARLLARFYDPRSGVVRVDGRDLRRVALETYRRQLGVVLQDPFLFSGTIADNLRFAKPDATDAELAAIASAIGIDQVAARLDGGLHHHVREGGAGLSAGERQLISIGRALIADPRILILDEATSNIDRPTEVLIERALDRLLAGRTSLIIAHRLSTVRRADVICVVDHGRIVQRGTYDGLISVEGPFQRLASELVGSRPARRAPARTPRRA
jgi:ABC-type multidrug transport system fused ATPase/permease subunit